MTAQQETACTGRRPSDQQEAGVGICRPQKLALGLVKLQKWSVDLIDTRSDRVYSTVLTQWPSSTARPGASSVAEVECA